MSDHEQRGLVGGLVAVGRAFERALGRAFAPVTRHASESRIWTAGLQPLFAWVAARVPAAPQAAPGGLAWAPVAVFYVGVVVAGAVLVVVRRVDDALRQMHLEGGVSGSALGLPVSFENVTNVNAAQETVTAIVEAWEQYDAAVARPTALRPASSIARDLIVLDLWFIGMYALLLAIVLVTLYRAATQATNMPAQTPYAQRYGAILATAGVSLVALLVVDLAENVELFRALVLGQPLIAAGPVAIGPLLSLLKVVLTVAVLIPLMLVSITLLLGSRALLQTLSAARTVVVLIALLMVLLSFGIIAGQATDVIRAWTWVSALFGVAAALLLAVVTAGVTRELAGPSARLPDPDGGASSQPLLLGAGVAVLLLGLLTWLLGLGWGLSIAGAILLVLWLCGVPIGGLTRGDADDEHTRGDADDEHTRGDADGVHTPVADDEPTPVAQPQASTATYGVGLGRFLGAMVLALLVWVIARAIALDVLARRPVQLGVVMPPTVAALVAIAGGYRLITFRINAAAGDAPGWRYYTRQIWIWATAAVLCGLFVLSFDVHAVDGAQAAGSIAVIFLGFAFVIGMFGLVATLFRGVVSRYQLPPALRVLRLQRFPVVTFLVLWIAVVSILDEGGYHDIRRDSGRAPGRQAPTIGAAWEQWASAQRGQADARPIVFVAAQGGGIRSAVWTALVMECIFGPGPVQGSGDACAAGSGQTRQDALAAAVQDPTPLFLASGASGGSVGIAAWSARRADLVQDGARAQIPGRVEDALSDDFVAPVVARMFTADIPRTVLAWERADRAEMLERGWERAWPGHAAAGPNDPAARGLTRGLRALWDVTHGDTQWATPVLALNGVSVEDGCRVLASAVDFALPRDLPATMREFSAEATAVDDQPNDAACRGPERTSGGRAVDILPSTSELVDYLCPDEDVSLATAAHLSARFPYVSPTGRITRTGCLDEPGLVPAPAVSYDADGGIFDNSGSGTINDVWRSLGPVVAARERQDRSCYAPIVVQIDNSPPTSTVSAGLDSRPVELLAPITATVGQVTSRDAYARASTAAAFSRPLSPSGRAITFADGTSPDTLWFRISLFGQPGPEPPLGWTLAPETVTDMRSQLMARQNAEQFAKIQALLADQALTCR